MIRVVKLIDFDGPIFRPRRRAKPKGIPVTVCIAARCGESIVCVSDRMVSAGDIQFEPRREKIIQLTSAMVIMTAGDASYTTLVVPAVMRSIHQLLEAEPDEWVRVRDVVDLYVKHFLEFKSTFAERELLAPLGLTLETFIERQRTMDPAVVKQLSGAILDYQVPDCAVIIAGKDPDGTHIYTVEGTYISALDSIGFATVGIGARHAQSQMMQSQHHWNAPVSDGLLASYVAKRRAEVAPGVGKETDIVIIGPNLGSTVVVAEHVHERLAQAYDDLVLAEMGAAETARTAIALFVQELTGAAGAIPQDQSQDEEPTTEPTA